MAKTVRRPAWSILTCTSCRRQGSQDEFDQWFKKEVMDTTGVDLSVPPQGPLSEILSVYEA